MGQVLHGSAATTHAVRAAIQRSEASIAELSRTYGVNPKTIAKWKRRQGVDDAPMGPKEPRSTVLTSEEEALAVAFRRHTLLPLDDCLYALQATIPNLTRSSLHRLFQRHDISRLPEVEGSKPKKKFKVYPIGYFHIDIAEVWTEEGKLYMLVAVDRTSKFAFAELHERITRRDAGNFLRRLIDAVPYRIHTVLTDNGTHFTDPKGDGWTAAEVRQLIAEKAGFRCHGFVLACAENDIDHRLTKPNHPWTNGQVERMNRTIKDATVRRYHYQSHERLRQHLAMFLDAYNFAKRLKTLKGLTVFEFINEKWTSEPERFRLHPNHLIPGPNI
jgi:transposase InsO family protein